jgi:hypothetical protein
MSRRSRAAYHAQIDRPIAWCSAPQCGNRNARFSKTDGKYLCADCRAAARSTGPGPTWTPEQWASIEHYARIASNAIRSSCAPGTAMRKVRQFAAVAMGLGGKS